MQYYKQNYSVESHFISNSDVSLNLIWIDQQCLFSVCDDLQTAFCAGLFTSVCMYEPDLPSVLFSSPSTSMMASRSSSLNLWISSNRAPFLRRISSSSERSSGLRSAGTEGGREWEIDEDRDTHKPPKPFLCMHTHRQYIVILAFKS